MSNEYRISGLSTPRQKRLLVQVTLAFLAIWLMVLAGCASKLPPVVPVPPRLAQPPAELMEPRTPNLRQRLQQLSTPSQPTATKPSVS